MKILLFLLITSGLNYASTLTYESQLVQDLNEIAELIPNQDLFRICELGNYNNYNASGYISSFDFSDGLFLLSRHPAMQPIKKYLDSNGINVIKLFHRIIKKMESKTFNSYDNDSGRKALKFKSFVDLAYSLPQTDNIVGLVVYKTATSKAFRILYQMLSKIDFHAVYEDMMKFKKFKNMIADLHDHGINTLEIWRAFSYLFGWDQQTNIISLAEYEMEEDTIDSNESPLLGIVRQFLNLIPKEKFIFLYRGLIGSPIFQEIIKFIARQDYLDLIDKLDKNPDIGRFFDYLQSRGASIQKILELLTHRLGFVYTVKKIPDGEHEVEPTAFSLYRFFELAKEILPRNEIRKLSIELLDENEEYREFHSKVLALAQNPSVELFFENLYDLRNTAMQYGFSSCRILNFLFAILGIDIQLPVKGKEFTDGIYEFIDLIPKKSYIDLYHKYKNDLSLWKLVTYLKDAKFIKFVIEFVSTSQVQTLSNYLIKAYVPVKLIIVDIMDHIGILQWFINVDFMCSATDKCEGSIDPNADNMVQLVKERTNLFPVRDMLILFHSKLLNSPHFQNLYLVVSHLNMANLYEKIAQNQFIRKFFVRLTKVGYNMRLFMENLSQLFGWGNITAIDVSLNQTFENYDNLLYRKELFKILDKYPNEMQQIKGMFKNSAFLNSLNLFVNEEPIRNIITWMEKLNVPVIKYINSLTQQNKTNSYQHLVLDTDLKWERFQKDIGAFLRKNKLYEFSVKQKWTSIEFNALLEKLYAVKLNMLSLFFLHPEFHYVKDKLIAARVNFLNAYVFLEDVLFDLHVKNYNVTP